MASTSDARAVKSLNKAPGRRRFTFETFSQRLEQIEIAVFRSLDPQKSEPSKGPASFFYDCLVQWRELNTAEDFISFFEVMMPKVQTLSLVILHKELILSELLSRLTMKARLSLEPILRLIAALSRDLLEDFLPFLQRVADSLVSLLKSGADREPEIIEQIFTSWVYIMMYLQKYLVQDTVHLLKVTVKLRYYPKDYVQEFMAEAMSFLLRNAPVVQLIKGIRKIMFEVVRKPLHARKVGVSGLLRHTVRGTSSRFHSRAEQVLRLLIDNTIFDIGDKYAQGSETIIEVVISTFQRLCEELEPRELNLMWDCLFEEIADSVSNKCLLHASHVLFLLISTVQIDKGRKISDYQKLLELVKLLVQTCIEPSRTVGADDSSGIVNSILQLMLHVLDGLHSSNDMSAISGVVLEWAPVFELRNQSLLNFIRELILKDPCISYIFRNFILSTLNDLTETSKEEVIYLLLTFCERMQGYRILDGISEDQVSRICNFLERDISRWVGLLNDVVCGNASSIRFDEAELALLYGVISCYPYVLDILANPALLMNLVDALDQFLTTDSDVIAGLPKQTWQSLIGVILCSYHKLDIKRKIGPEETAKFLHFAKRYKSSSHVLSSVACLLDSMHGATLQADINHKVFHPELSAEKTMEAVEIFSENLCHSNKEIRISTLRILCHYEPLNGDEQLAKKKMKLDVSDDCHLDAQCSNVLELLHLIDATPLSVSTSRKVILFVSKIQMSVAAARICEAYIPLVLNGIIGILNNRFSYLWNPALECLAVLISKHAGFVWDRYVNYLEKCQHVFLTSPHELDTVEAESSNSSNDLVKCFRHFVDSPFDGTPCSTMLTLLLQSLQKIPNVVELKCQEILPLFLKFLGYNTDDLSSVGSFKSHACKGKEWKIVFKEWLNLLKLMRNLKTFYHSQFLKVVLQHRLLDENDTETQMKVLECLLIWKDDFLLPYDQHLKNLISSKNLREEITTWSLSKESNLIEEHHRAHLVPFIIQLLMPKVRNLKLLGSRKHASVHHRKAVLGFIAQLDVDELALFYVMIIKPLLMSNGTEYITNGFWCSSENFADDFKAVDILKYFTMDAILVLPLKKRFGFMYVIEDILGVFDGLRVRPFLDLLVGCVVRVLGSCSTVLDTAKYHGCFPTENNICVDQLVHDKIDASENHSMSSTVVKQLKELRSLCLRIISLVLNNYEDHDFGCGFWDLFFMSVKPLIRSFKQEGASSEKPSSLFSCFVAMSRSNSLVSLLYREENLVPDIFSILTVTTASEAITSCVLRFIENLLNLTTEMSNEDCVIKRPIFPNIEPLVCSLHCHFLRNYASKRKLVKCSGEMELNLFKLLSKYLKEPFLAKKFVEILLPFIAKKPQNSDLYAEILQVIRDVIPILEGETTSKILNAISPLLISAGLSLRLSICDLLDDFSQTDPSVLTVAKIVRELNATSAIEMGDLDYDTIVNAYEKIGIDFFGTIRQDLALVILSHFVYDMSSEEIILRHSAFRSFLLFVEFCSLIVGKESRNHLKMPEVVITSIDDSWTGTRVLQIINKFLLKHMGEAMKTSFHKEWIDLLREMVLKLPQVPSLASLEALCSKDAEVDFFNNIIHLQKHRRARALSRFKCVVCAGNLSEDILNNVFIPLFLNMLFDVQDGKGEHVRNACLETLASISGHLEWTSYYALLNRCFQEIKLKPDKKKLLLRLICSILDHFHFKMTSLIPEAEGPEEDVLNSDMTESHSLTVLRQYTYAKCTEIQICLRKNVLPRIQKMLNSDSENVNVNISLAALKLLKLLPEDIMESQLSSIVHRLSNFLKNRLESIRDEARSALAACLKELGVEYLQFIISVLRATLKRGYELHVLGYSLNFILSKILLNPVCGKLDYCLEDILSVVENDIFGDVAEEKEVEKIASKMKETRKSKSFDTLRLIAQNITFRSHALKLLSPVTAHLQKHLTPKIKLKLEGVLNHIAAGIEGNPSVDQIDLFIFIYGLIEDRATEGNHQGKDSSACETCKDGSSDTSIKTISPGWATVTESQCSHLITVFALRVLHNRLKNVKLDSKDEQLLSMLDPFVKLLGTCLSSKYEDVLSVALRCLESLISLPLPAIDTQSDKIKVALLNIALCSADSSSPLMHSCLKLLTVLLRSKKITLSTDQLHLLIQSPLFVDLERCPSIVALTLLKAIVNRKLVVPEIYDLVSQVAELMIKNQVDSIRKKCSQILLQFLLDYHLSGKRLQQHLDFLLANLRYEHSTGREAALEMLHTIINKFPKSIVDEQSQIFFVHLVVCLANDHDSKIRSMIGTAIKNLIERISSHSLHSIIEYSLSWYLGGKQQLCSAGAQVLGLLVEAVEKGFQKHIHTILPVMTSILRSAVNAVTDKQLNLSNEAIVPLWKEAYYSLILLEKMLHEFNELCYQKNLEDIWEAVLDLMLHPHMWLRNISNRLVALYFAMVTEACKGNCGKSLGTFFLMRHSRLFRIAVSLCCQLMAPPCDDDASSNLITQNLVFSICAVHSLMGQKQSIDAHTFWSTLEPYDHDHFLKAFLLLDSRKGRSMFSSLIAGVFVDKDQGNDESLQYIVVSRLLKRMGKISLEMDAIQMKTVFSSFRKISLQIGQDACQHYATEMLLPLYKVCEGFSGKIIPDDVKQLAQEACQDIRNIIGIQNFVQVYNLIRKNLKGKRDKRKQEEKLMAVINPMRNAKRKLRIASRHKAHKKRKIMTSKMARWMH